MAIRILQWGAGKNGSALIRAVAAHADTELVGCRVWSEAKHGVDAGVLAGIAPLGVPASNDRQAMLDLDADVAFVCPSLGPDLAENDRDIVDLLRSGKNVISVSGAHARPSAIPGYAEQFEQACREGNSTFAAGGLNPGFIAERLAPTLTGLCADVTAVDVLESYDCSVSNPDVFYKTMGFGLPLDQWSSDSPNGRLFDHLFTQSVAAMAEALGIKLREVRHSASVAPAPHDLVANAGPVAKGTVAAISQSWTGVPEDPDQIVVSKSTEWVCGKDIPGHPIRSGWRIAVTGKPSLVNELRLDETQGGQYLSEFMVAGAISIVPEVMKAPPGFLSPTIYAPFRKHFGGPQ